MKKPKVLAVGIFGNPSHITGAVVVTAPKRQKPDAENRDKPLKRGEVAHLTR